jgi:hypothetical protein
MIGDTAEIETENFKKVTPFFVADFAQDRTQFLHGHDKLARKSFVNI